MPIVIFTTMPSLYLNGIKAFDDLGARSGVLYFFYALAGIIVFLWIIISFSKSKGLVNHHNAVAVRALVNFLRTVDYDTKQTGELFTVITKNKNDISMLFYLYCRIHTNFAFIEHYLNYKAYKHVNKKKKPWGFTPVVAVAILITLVFSISYFVGIQYFLDMDMNMSDLLLALAFPLALFLVWLMFRVLILMKYKMYWIEFENKFRKVNVMCKSFFKSQEQYFDEFADNILDKLVPTGGTKRRIERIIAMTDPDEIDSMQPYPFERKPKKAKVVENDDAPPRTASIPPAAAYQAPPRMPEMQGMMPRGTQVMKPHPETEAYLHAQTQITQQLMQMMMQQSMQQSQVVQRALTSQQALANSVVQQNIMAMRLEAQQASLLRPDLAKRLAEQSYAWPGDNRRNVEHVMDEDIKVTDKSTGSSTEVKPDIVDIEIKQEVKETIIEVEEEKPKPKKAEPKKDELILKLTEAFAMLSPPQRTSSESDPVFVAPARDRTNVEKRLSEFFTATVYVYDDTEGEVV